MKRLIEDVSGEGFESLMGERVTLFCMNYIYTGKLIGFNDKFVLLSDPAIVYETGSFQDKDWKDAQKLPHGLCVMLSSVESFGLVKE